MRSIGVGRERTAKGAAPVADRIPMRKASGLAGGSTRAAPQQKVVVNQVEPQL